MCSTGFVSADIHELFKSVVKDNYEDFHIDIKGFDGLGEGFIGEVLFVTITNKITKEK